MKYLLKYKLFEDHKETLLKIKDLEIRYSKEKNDILNNYKSLIDDFMFEISDYYQTESEFIYEELYNYKPNYYIAYDIVFPGDKYEDFIKKLKEVTSRLKDSYDISYKIDHLYDLTNSRDIPIKRGGSSEEDIYELVRSILISIHKTKDKIELRILF
jgi:hypothetical protein